MSEIEFPSFEELVNPKHSVVLVIDMQNDFCSERGVAVKGADLSGMKEMAKRLGYFLTEARKLNTKIMHTSFTSTDWSDSPAWTRVFKDLTGKICAKGKWGANWFEDVEALQPKPGEYVIEKHRYSAFVGTDLDIVLKSIGARTVILTGTATNVCVESTARDALMHDYHVVILEDCVGSTFSELHKATLENIKLLFGTVVTSPQLLEAWPKKEQS